MTSKSRTPSEEDSSDRPHWLKSKIDVTALGDPDGEEVKKEAVKIRDELKIKQRKCVKPSNTKDPFCLCGLPLDQHDRQFEGSAADWLVRTNTIAEPLEDKYHGVIGTCISSSESFKFARVDVMTKMSTIEKLLVDVWKLKRPSWIISFMGDTLDREKYQKEQLRWQVRTVLERFSICGGLWVTCNGCNKGLSYYLGKAIQDFNKDHNDHVHQVTGVGINAWGLYTDKVNSPIRKEKTRGKHQPCSHFKHHIMVDDGSNQKKYYLKSFSNFKINLEISLAGHTEDSQSIPLVSILFGGSENIIDAVQKAVNEKVPIIVIKNSGGFAGLLGDLLEGVSGKNETSSFGDGTVIDEDLRKKVESALKQSFPTMKIESEVNEHTYKILKCVRKRELFTVVEIEKQVDESGKQVVKLGKQVVEVRKQGDLLADAIIGALFKTMTQPEVFRLLDYYLPYHTFDGDGISEAEVFSAKYSKEFTITMKLFLWVAMWMDQADVVDFIIDHGGISTRELLDEGFLEDTKTTQTDHMKGEVEDADIFRIFLERALDKEKEKCAVLFWKKGNELLTFAMFASDNLNSKARTGKSITVRRKFKEQAELFDKRAMGMIDVCFDHDEENTMDLIQSQTANNKWNKNLLIHCLIDGNNDIFGTDAYKEYMRRVWFGKIIPPVMGEETQSEQLQKDETSKEGCSDILGRLATAPVTKYIIHLVFFIVFLGIFGHTLLFGIRHGSVSGWEITLAVWWLGLVVEEIRQFQISKVTPDESRRCCNSTLCSKLQRYLIHNPWNILDVICLSMFIVGALLVAAYHNTESAPTLNSARVFLSIDLMLFIWRIIQYLTIFDIMGSVFEMIIQTLKVLFPFLVIMAVFIFAQGVATFALLYPVTNWSGDIFIDIPKNAFWNIFGELFLDDIEATESMDQSQCSNNVSVVNTGSKNRCPSTVGSYVVPFLLGVHMIITNVIILNLLIARFTFTFEQVHKETENIAAWQRAKVTLEFCRKPLAPPPLNMLYHIYYFIQSCCFKEEPKETRQKRPNGFDESWERKMGEHYLVTHEIKHGNKKISILKDSKESDQLIVQGSREHQQLIRLICDMDAHLQETHADVEDLKVGLKALNNIYLKTYHKNDQSM